MTISRTLFAVLTVLAPLVATAAPVTGWVVVNPSTGGFTTKPLANQLTASPILGNGTEDSAATVAMYAPINGPADGSPDISLANGQQVTLTGFATLTGITNSMEQFRWGLFQESSEPINAVNWTGFMAANSANNSGGALRAKAAGDGTTFAQSGSGVTLQTSQDGDEFIDETYQFAMTVARYNNEVKLDASLTSADDWTQRWSTVASSPTPLTFDFNRVGFLAGGGMHANQINFSNIDVTTSAIDTLTLQVFTTGPDAGTVRIRNDRPGGFDVEYYEITSDAGSLSDNYWTSLDAQEGVDDEFEGWEEAAGNGQELLSEYRLLSTLNIAPSSTLTLGKAFDAGGAEDLKFFVGLSDGSLVRGVVEYISEGLTGDFNRDSSVDAADYTVWRKGLGTSNIEPDYALWRHNFGANQSGTGQAAVPEPATMLLLLTVLCAHLCLFRPLRRRFDLVSRLGAGILATASLESADSSNRHVMIAKNLAAQSNSRETSRLQYIAFRNRHSLRLALDKLHAAGRAASFSTTSMQLVNAGILGQSEHQPLALWNLELAHAFHR